MDQDISSQSRKYSAIKYGLAVIDLFYLLLFLFLFLCLGFSQKLADFLSLRLNHSLALPVYILIISSVYYLLDFPLNFYRSFTIERRFSLSNQRFLPWLADQIKAAAITYLISVVLFAVFYYLLRHYPGSWWLVISLFWIFFSLILARLLPVIIIPLFFKYRPYSDAALKERIMVLAERMKVKVLDIFEIDFSKKTLKANAAFVGWGRTKRVLLADTLKDKYTSVEIEAILAHEFAHYKLGHLFKLILVNAVSALLIFYIISRTNTIALRAFSLTSLSEFRALPLVVIYFIIFGIITQPLENYISRRFERDADTLAVKITGLKDAFVSMMDKLATQNLADRKPHPVIKFFFFDHPPIDERIAYIGKL